MRKGLKWLVRLAPLLTVLAILWFGPRIASLEKSPRALRAEPPATGEPAPPEPVVALRFTDSTGAPAAGGRILLIQPSLSSAETDADGVARLPYLGRGKFEIRGYLPGHQLLRPPAFGAAPAEGFAFQALEPADVGRPEPEPVRGRTLQLQCAADSPPGELPAALVLAYPPEGDPQAPWGALAAADGTVNLPATSTRGLRVEVYSAELPVDPAWRLATTVLAADGGTGQPLAVELSWSRITLTGLPPSALLTGERLDVPGRLPPRPAAADGSATWDGLPPGSYRFSAGGRHEDVQLRPGARSAAFEEASPDAPQG